ncbi:Ig-like domain-containing protein [Leptospira idonii]|uniref:SbsA Ig-like domain-containing protein n=1 Tax=Leptospira idonii TaxID=1193500 RepID=A0A4R9M1E8_9LEPT|nr:Ig-like domain-containing protein [Leptospira idonii]TGN19791.1 hypothetical protein EHS15_07020 [Leptospira idonii]
MGTRLFYIFLCSILIHCSQLLDNGEGPLSFLPEVSLLKSSTPPKILFADPPDGAIGISEDTQVRVMFSEKMNPNYTQSSFSLLREGTSIEGSFLWIDNLLTFTPYRPLTDPGLYTYNISKARAENLNGANLIDDYKASFSYSRDLVKPKISQVLPENGATGVPTNTLITVQFTKSMDRLSVLGAISVSPSVELNLANTIVLNDDKTFQFVPKYPLNYGTVYQIQIAETAKDKSGNQLSQSSSTVFTVGDDLVAPLLTSVSTTSVTNFLNQEIFLVNGVNKNDSILLEFSKPVQPLSVLNGIRISPSKTFTVSQLSPISFEVKFADKLDAVTIYEISIGDAIIDFQNNKLGKTYVYNVKTIGDQTQKIQLRGFFSNSAFTTSLYEDRINLSSPPLTPCASATECDQNLYIRFCYGETRATCTDTLTANGQILLSSLRMTISRDFGQPIGANQEYFENPVDATPGALAPNVIAFSTVAKYLDRGSTYSITVKGGTSGLRDNHGNYMDSDQTIIVRFP